jgi:uncharacterized membrane protein
VNNCVFGRAFFQTGILFIYLLFFSFSKILFVKPTGLISTAGEKKRSVRSANKCLSTALPAAILFLFFYRPRVKQHSSSSSSPIFLQPKNYCGVLLFLSLGVSDTRQ